MFFITLIIQKVKKWRLNALDIIIITAILVVVGIFLWLRISKKTEWINVRLVVANDEWWWEGQPPQWWYVDSLQSGQVAYSSFGEKVAEIVNVDIFDIGAYRRRAFIDITLKGAFDSQRKLYLYNFQPLQIGKPLDLTFGKNNVRGIITYIDDISITYSQRQIEVRVLKVRPWVAESLTKGLEMKDSQGRVLAKIDEVKTENAIYYEFSDIRGQRIQVIDPEFRDVTAKVTIKTFTSGVTDYFVDRGAIKVGEKIWFQFPQAVIREAEITKIFE